MGRIVSVHEYELRTSVQEKDFELAIKKARDRGLLQLPGLIDFYLLKGVRGVRKGRFAAIWIFKDRESWERLWGSADQPFGKETYPAEWKTWEAEVLAPFLSSDPDRIAFTAYEEI